MKSIIQILILASTILIPVDSYSSCPSHTGCYCQYRRGVPPSAFELLHIQVLENRAGAVSFKLLGTPMNETSTLQKGDVFTDVDCLDEGDCVAYTAGDQLLVLCSHLHMDDSEPMVLANISKVVDGMVLCSSLPDYPGLTIDQVVQVTSLETCDQDLYAMGFPRIQCDDTGCHQSNQSDVFLLAVFSMLLLGRMAHIRKNRNYC